MRRPTQALLFMFAILALMVTPASAQDATLQTSLDPLNDSGTSGSAMVSVSGNQVTVTVNTSSASPGQPHAQHLHIGGRNECPTQTADSNGDGVVSTPEGKPAYGGIKVSLTTEGDVSAKSALAVSRFPVASDDGSISYERTFPLPSGVSASDLNDAVVVQHGIADSQLGSDDTKYDGPDSPLKKGVPQEATLPSTCGAFSGAPIGGIDTGGGGTAGDTDAPLAGGILALMAGAAAVAVVGVRLRASVR